MWITSVSNATILGHSSTLGEVVCRSLSGSNASTFFRRTEFTAVQHLIRPLQAEDGDANELCLLAPNRFVDRVNDKYLKRINELLRDYIR